MNLFKEIINEFENPLLEATCKIYYFVKTLRLIDLNLSYEKITDLIKLDKDINEERIFRSLDTSHLVIILKIFNMLDLKKKVDKRILDAIENEIKNRIIEKGIIDNREGMFSSEATYYTLFFYFINDNLQELKDISFLDDLIFRLYRNLELIRFSEDITHDLFSEIFYSFESLKLINCIGCKEMSIKLSKFLFPKKVVNEIDESNKFAFDKTNFRNYYVNKITGEISK
jgi:hypothetical protein